MKRLLVANRGEIACRILTTARELGISTVAIYSDADRYALHPTYADRAIALGPDDPSPAYLDVERILSAARETGTDAIHPGYGFLAESASFATASAQSGVSSAGLTTAVHPAASAGAILRVIIAIGKFHGVMAAMTPIGCLIVM